jgi:hypothetical protein
LRCAADHRHHRSLAAEQMGAAGDVQEQAVGRIERHQRREAVAPVGNMIQRFAIGSLIGVEHLYVRTDGAGIGERQADFEAETGCGIIERGNLQRVVLFGDDDARTVARPLEGIVDASIIRSSLVRGILASRRGVAARALSPDAIGRQPWQPQAENAPSLHGRDTHHISIP